MSAQVRFVHLAKTEALEKFTQDHIDPLLKKFLGRDNVASSVVLKMENSPDQAGKDVFHCDIDVKDKKLGRPVRVTESAINLYQAIAKASHRLKYLLMRYKDRHVEGPRRRGRYRNRWQQPQMTADSGEAFV